ncbi:MAG TPA: cytochrome C [bacterium]|nr:cytochrome C [bacterium]
MTRRTGISLLAAAVALGAVALAPRLRAEDAKPPAHQLPPAARGGTVIGMCDGKTSIEVADLKPGQSLDPARAQQVSDQLMAAWREKNPGARWDDAPAATRVAAADASGAAKKTDVSGGGSAKEPTQNGVYESFTSRDEEIWAAETAKFIDEGKGIFHDPAKLGGTVGVSCGNCHPNGANTHPETYPKYQQQLHRVALLRDMINWCIENPVKGKALADDDPKMRALEAYILSTRKGTALDYGKH